jgi:hypothetical protein
MTEVPENAPKQDLTNIASVKMTPKGRVIEIRKDCEKVKIMRKTDKHDWETLSTDAPIPYLDSDKITGVHEIEYKVEIGTINPENLSLKVFLP